LAADPTTGILYGMQDVPVGFSTAANLFSINANTGVATVIGSMGTGSDFSAMAFNAAGTLFVVSSNGRLFTINKTTGAPLTNVALTGFSGTLGNLEGLAIDPVTGTAYFATGGSATNSLYTLNTNTGALTLVGALVGTTDGLAGLTFSPVPEPGTLAMGALGVVILGFARRLSRWS